MINSLQVPFETGLKEAQGCRMQDVGREALQLRKWEGGKVLTGLISTVMSPNTAYPALSREGRRQGKEHEVELIKLLSHLRSWDSFSKEGGLVGPKDTCFHPFSSPYLSYV